MARWLFSIGFAVLLVIPAAAAPASAALNCAFKDVNDNGVFDPGTDVIVPDSAWIGTPLVSNDPFVVPAGCDFELTSAPTPLLGIRVIATKITIIGSVQILKPGGRGIVLIADRAKVPSPGLGDESITIGAGGAGSPTKVFAGGVDLFVPLNTRAVERRSIAIWAIGKCFFQNADIEGTVPTGATEVGINCGEDITFRGSTVVGSRINIQSIDGVIDARSFAPVAAGTLGDFCDDPVKNLQGGAAAPGNGNHTQDAGDFPCVLDFNALAGTLGVKTFANKDALLAFCGASGVGGPNKFLAFNDPLTMIAQKNLDLRGAPSSPPPFLNPGDTVVKSHTRVVLASITGDVLASNTQVSTTIPTGTPAGGAKIFVIASPAVFVPLPVDHEHFVAPGTGTLDIQDACFESVPPVSTIIGTLTGIPDPPPCKQPAEFVPVPSAP